MSLKELLETRRRIKARKPKFLRENYHAKKKLGKSWRRPCGSDSKMRVRLKGYNRSVTKGWKSPAETRGLTKDGLRPATVLNVSDLSKLNPKTDIVVIGAGVGDRKRVTIIEEALKKGLRIINYKEPQKKADAIRQTLKKKKEEKETTKKERESKKEKAKKEAEKKKAEKKEETPEQTEEEKKLEEKKEKDKLLISTN